MKKLITLAVLTILVISGCNTVNESKTVAYASPSKAAIKAESPKGILCTTSTPSCLEAFEEKGRLCKAGKDCPRNGYLLKVPH